MRKASYISAAALALFTASEATAGIKGSVSFGGSAPAAKAIDMASDPKCKKMSPDAKNDDVVVSGGKLANAVVYVKNAPDKKYKAPKQAVTLDQKGCMYVPKSFGIMENQDLEIINSDPTLHNVHAFAKRGEFNVAMPRQGQKIKKKFKKAEMVEIKCDVHSWMKANAAVFKHPYFAVSGADGSFDVPTAELPDGDYDVVAWHPTLGEKSGKASVKGGNATVDFAFGK